MGIDSHWRTRTIGEAQEQGYSHLRATCPGCNRIADVPWPLLLGRLIERCVNRLKQFRRIATRYEKTARAYLSMLCVAAAKLWIKTVNTA